jgi:hypothetical protein
MKSENRRWGVVSSAWLRHPAIGIDEFAVLSYLTTCMAPDGSGIEPSQGQIARQLKVSRSRVNRTIAHLCDVGILVKERRYESGAGEVTCRYRIQIHADGNVVAAGVSVPSVLRQTCGERDESVTRSDMPPSQDVTPPVSDRHTNQDSKIHTSTPRRVRPENDWSLRQEQGREGSEPAGLEPTLVDEHWVPTAADLAWAGKHCPGLDILRHTQEYITGCRAKGRVYQDHSAAWRSWALKGWARPQPSSAAPAHRGGEGQGRRTGRAAASAASLHESNLAAADACLERINRRRGVAL